MSRLAVFLLAMVMLLFAGLISSAKAQTEDVPRELVQRFEERQSEKPVHYLRQNNLRSKSASELSVEQISLLAKDIFFETKNVWGTNMGMLSDQLTTHNAVYNWRDYSAMPRKAIQLGEYKDEINLPFENFTFFHFEVQKGLQLIEDSSMVVSSGTKNVTEAMRANLYFLQGLNLGYSALIYDQVFIADPEVIYNYSSLEELIDQGLELQSYTVASRLAIDYLEEAISIAETTPEGEYTWGLIDSPNDINRDNFIKMVHSVIAKILINTPRTYSELQDLDTGTIIAHAEDGIDDKFMNIIFNSEGDYKFYDEFNDWSSYLLSGPYPYIPRDIKIPFLMDEDYPSNSPMGGLNMVIPNSDDPRLTAYYEFIDYSQISYINRPSSPELLGTHYSMRMYADNNWGRSGLPFIFMTQSELQYIKAEAYFLAGNVTKANEALQNSPYGSSPTELEIDLPSVQAGYLSENGVSFGGPEFDGNMTSFRDVLLKEYSIELDGLATIGSQWFMMRRHDMLQRGTALHYPVPEHVQEQLDIKPYTFGGIDNFLKSGTATGINAWHDIPSPPGGLSLTIKDEAITLSWAQEPDETVTGFKIYNNASDRTINLSASENTYEFEGLENGTDYSFRLSAINESGESVKRAKRGTPNLLGALSTVRLGATKRLVQHRADTLSIPLTNFKNEEIQISFSLNSVDDDPDIYKSYMEFFTLKPEFMSLEPGQTRPVEIVFKSKLWGEVPGVELVIENDFDNDIIKPFIRGGLVKPSNSRDPSTPDWQYYFNAPEAVSFGQVSEGDEQVASFTIFNTNIRTLRFDTLFVEYFNEMDSNYYPDSIFTVIGNSTNNTIEVRPLEGHAFELKANPVSSNPHEAYLRTFYNSNGFGVINLNRLEVNKGNEVTKVGFELENNYPNPFNPSTTIEFKIPERGFVTLSIYNVIGQKVATLVNEDLRIGRYTINFDASGLSSGVYFYQLQHNGQTRIKKMTLIK